jgi:hypothetical protein
MLRMDVPRRDPTAETAMLRLRLREEPRLPTLRRARREVLTATVAECIRAKGRHRRRT